MLKVCLTHDIDRVVKSHQYITRTARALLQLDHKSLIRQGRSLFDKHPYWGFDKMIEIENKNKVKSTVFFLNESIKHDILKPSTYKLSAGRYKIHDKRIVDIIQYLDANGWEIGVHGSYRSYKDIELLKREKAVLEEIVGHEVIGIRQHYLNMNDMTWKYQYEAGFKYDSTLGFTRKIGFKDGHVTPFSPFNNDFFVFPLALMDFCFMETPNKWEEFEKLIDHCERENGLFVVNYHQNNFHEPDFPGYMDSYIEIIERCEKRGAAFMTIGDAYRLMAL